MPKRQWNYDTVVYEAKQSPGSYLYYRKSSSDHTLHEKIVFTCNILEATKGILPASIKSQAKHYFNKVKVNVKGSEIVSIVKKPKKPEEST